MQRTFLYLIAFLGITSGLLTSCGDKGGETGGETTTTTTGTTGSDETPLPTDVKNYRVPQADDCAKPASMADLTSGIKKLFYQVTSNNAANLQLFGQGVSLGKKEMMVIVDFVQFKDMSCSEKVRYGVGARLQLHVKKAHLGANFDFSNLRGLAANCELGKATVKYSLDVIGITGPKVLDALPKAADNNFDVEGYSQVMMSVDKIQSMAKDGIEGVIITPQVIPVEG